MDNIITSFDNAIDLFSYIYTNPLELSLLAVLIAFFAPLCSAIIIAPFVSSMSHRLSHYISCILLLLSFLASAYLFNLFWLADHSYGSSIISIKLWDWITLSDYKANFGVYFDSLTALMFFVVTTVSALVHIYSVGYMSEDPHQPRFMAYLSLFTFFMLVLVSANNFLQLFLGWEGVGLSSYLLIGFWFKKESATAAAVKAFIVNRIGDIGLALGVFAIFFLFGTLDYNEVFSKTQSISGMKLNILGLECDAITLVCAFLFFGCMGKSAQIGLHVWLPDAMEGPTPVSALIHAATMVTAGVFLVVRCSPMFEYAPEVLVAITIIGAVTAIFAASIGLVQNDIKRIIAYSTCSQLGYMFFACGVSAYAVSMFHLMTHAFFKALLFLSAGSVIHALHGEQDVQKMGGLSKKIMFTYIMMLIGSLALAGIPPFAGYFSKDKILEVAYARGNIFGDFAYYIGIVAALMTAFYSWRLIILTFNGKTRLQKDVISHAHEGGMSIKLPLFILSIGAVLAGVVGHDILQIDSPNASVWQGVILVLEQNNTIAMSEHITDKLVKYAGVILAFIGILLAYLIYYFRSRLFTWIISVCSSCNKTLYNKYYFDELYGYIVLFFKYSAELFWRVFDIKIIDGLPNGSAKVVKYASNIISRLHAGYLYYYASIILFGMLILLYLMIKFYY